MKRAKDGLIAIGIVASLAVVLAAKGPGFDWATGLWTTLQRSTSPDNPSTGYATIFAKTDGRLYTRTAAGIESPLATLADLTTSSGVTGPGSSTNGHLATWNGTNGAVLADGGAVPAAGDNLDPLFFGDGSDGTLTVTSGLSTLARDMQFQTLTISGTGAINTSGYRIAVKGTLTLDNAPANAITWAANPGGNASGTGAGSAGSSISSQHKTLGGAAAGYAGKAGGTAGGTTGTNQTSTVIVNGIAQGGDSGAGGTGGNAGANNGGSGGTTASISSVAGNLYVPLGSPPLFYGGWIINSGGDGPLLVGGGVGGSGGGSGAGDGTAGGGSGGGGSGGTAVGIWARTISRAASTTAGCISAVGGAGGNGGDPAGGNRGGGAGGGGGGGGTIGVVYRYLTGSTKAGAISATGGAGGNGGNKTGTGTDGGGGTGGYGGVICIYDIGAGTFTRTAGSVGSGPTSKTGGAGGACSVNL